MAGEQLKSAWLTENGIDGDRIVQVRSFGRRPATSRTFPDLLGFKATTGRGGIPLVDGKPWNDPEILVAVQQAVGPQARLIQNDSPDRFDVLPLLVATDGSIAAFGRDRRRLRPNIVIGGVPGLEERTWEGGKLLIGDVVIGIHDLRGRCVMTTFDPDTQEQDPDVIKDIVKRFQGKLALNCEVLQGGEIRVSQLVEVLKA
jgi:uncharacterized protein YcbX